MKIICRYLLLEWKFSSVEVGCRVLKGETSRKLQGFLRDQVHAYYGDYGVACVQHSLNGEWARMTTLYDHPVYMQSSITISQH